jgi:fatty-acyl-CoA synthase
MEKNLISLYEDLSKEDNCGINFWTPQNKGINSFSSYKSLYFESKKIAQQLHNIGVKKGDPVIIILPTCKEFVSSFMGAMMIGAIPAALYPPMRLGKIEVWKDKTIKCIHKVEAKVVLTNKRVSNFLGEVLHKSNTSNHCYDIQKILKSDLEINLPKISTSPDDLSFIQFSSGSTGLPSPVGISYENIQYNIGGILLAMNLDFKDINCVSWLPLYHDMGLVGILFGSMYSRGKLTLMPPESFLASPLSWLTLMSDLKASVGVAPNFAYGLCLEKIPAESLKNLDLSHWKVAMCGAEPIHCETLIKFCDKFGPAHFNQSALVPVYGLAEGTLAVSFSRSTDRPFEYYFDEHQLKKNIVESASSNGANVACVGRPLTNVKINIRGKDLSKLPDGQIGNIFISGPSIMRQYINSPEKNKDSFYQGELNTFDRGFIYDDKLFICGREKDLLIINGQNIDPSYIEQELNSIPEIRTGCTACISVSSQAKQHTESLVALCEVTKEFENTNSEEIERKIRDCILKNAGLNVDSIKLLSPGTLPRTSSGKISRSLSKKLFQEQALIKPKQATLTIVIKEMLSSYTYNFFNKSKRVLKKLTSLKDE